MLAQVFARLPNEHRLDLRAVHNTCKTFRHVVVNDGHLRHRYQTEHLALLVRKVAGRATKPDRAVQCVPLLPLLAPEQRGKLVDVVIHSGNYGGLGSWDLGRDTDWTTVRAHHIGRMAQGVAHLDEAQQTKLVKAATRFTESKAVAEAIFGFGTELAHLSAALRGELLNKAINLDDARDREVAISALSGGLAHLNPDQHEALLTSAIGLDHGDQRAHAIRLLCTGLNHLNDAQRDTLFESVVSLPPGGSQALSIANMGTSLGSLSPDQRNTLVKLTFDLINHHIRPFWAHIAIYGLAAGLELLTLPQRDTLVTQSMTQLSGIHKASAIAALAAGLAHLTHEQQDRLLDAASDLGTDSGRAAAVAGLAAQLAPLNAARKDRVVSMALGLPDDNSKAKVIAALGARLGHLEPVQHKAVVDAAIRLFKTETISKEMNRALGAGLGASLGSLHKDLRSALVHTVTRTLSPNDKQFRVLSAEAIAGLGAGHPHLDEAEYKALIAAATRPLSGSGWTSFRTPNHDVICAFAAEAIKAMAT